MKIFLYGNQEAVLVLFCSETMLALQLGWGKERTAGRANEQPVLDLDTEAYLSADEIDLQQSDLDYLTHSFTSSQY